MVKGNLPPGLVFLPVFLMVLSSCSFDYGNKESEENEKPDIVMENVEYVRVRGGDPVLRFQAARVERFEEKQTMNLRTFSFEQFENHGDGIDARGSAGEARVELESGNIQLGGGVLVSVESEDITIRTTDLRWFDKDRRLTGPSGNVDIRRSDGTSFSGRGFSADARQRTWTFESGVSGLYVDEEEEDAVIMPEYGESVTVTRIRPDFPEPDEEEVFKE